MYSMYLPRYYYYVQTVRIVHDMNHMIDIFYVVIENHLEAKAATSF